MALTADQARQAGVLQGGIDLLTGYITNLQAALANGSTIEWAAVRMGNGTDVFQYETPLAMNAADTATVINAMISVYQNNINAMQSQLATIT